MRLRSLILLNTEEKNAVSKDKMKRKFKLDVANYPQRKLGKDPRISKNILEHLIKN